MQLFEILSLFDRAANVYRSLHQESDIEPTTPKITCYQVLGVRRDASDEVVKAAYKAAAKKYHSDNGGDDRKMKVINKAYEKVARLRGWK